MPHENTPAEIVGRAQRPASLTRLRRVEVAAGAFVLVSVLLVALEFVKHILHPGMSLWESHLLTVGVSGAAAALAADLISRRAAQVAGAASLLAAIVESSDDAIVSTSLDGTILTWNSGAHGIYGYAPDEIVGRPISVLVPAGCQDEIAQTMQAVRRGERVDHYETKRVTKDGALIDVSLTVSPITNAKGETTAASSIARDITERKQMEEALAQRAADLARSNADLQQFAYVASHDLQEPLRMVSSYMRLLQRRYHDKLDDDANTFIDFAVDGASRMQDLITGLLDYSRVDARSEPFEPVDCQAALNTALANLRAAIHETRAVVTHDPLPTIIGDGLQISQLLQNLIGNALKYRRADPPRVHVSCRKEESDYVFCVRDCGIGIPPEDRERIFRMFERIDTDTGSAGTGIGLAVCKRIVERHGGRIWVESEPGTGSTFCFSIPER
jgi:PAS domain S-box-containing protein